jgi:hypothetical protein
MSNQQLIRDKWDELDSKMKEAEKLRKQLDASLLIQTLWTNAFKHGKCTCYLGGNLNEPKTMHFIIKDGIGQTKEFNLMDIPDSLLKRAIEFQKKPNGHNQWQIRQLDKLYEYITKRKEILNARN